MQKIENAYALLSDTRGRLADAGLLYIGEPNEDPEVQPAPVYWDRAGTQPAVQPLQTVAGIIQRDGTPARAYTPARYSSRLRQADGSEVYFDEVNDPPVLPNFVSSLAELKAADTELGTVLWDGTIYVWTLGDYTGQADDEKIIESDNEPLSTGAWVRAGTLFNAIPIGSRADALLISPTTDVNAIQTYGYYTQGDGGGGLYIRVEDEPVHDGKLETANNIWFELREDSPNVKQFGAKADKVYDDMIATNALGRYNRLKAPQSVVIDGTGKGARCGFPRGDYRWASALAPITEPGGRQMNFEPGCTVQLDFNGTFITVDPYSAILTTATNGTLTTFSFTMPYYGDETTVWVYKDTARVTTGFTVTIEGLSGSITFDTAPTSGTLRIIPAPFDVHNFEITGKPMFYCVGTPGTNTQLLALGSCVNPVIDVRYRNLPRLMRAGFRNDTSYAPRRVTSGMYLDGKGTRSNQATEFVDLVEGRGGGLARSLDIHVEGVGIPSQATDDLLPGAGNPQVLGDGTTTVFNFTSDYTDVRLMNVRVGSALIDTGYTLTNAGTAWTLTFTVAPGAGVPVQVIGLRPVRTSDFGTVSGCVGIRHGKGTWDTFDYGGVVINCDINLDCTAESGSFVGNLTCPIVLDYGGARGFRFIAKPGGNLGNIEGSIYAVGWRQYAGEIADQGGNLFNTDLTIRVAGSKEHGVVVAGTNVFNVNLHIAYAYCVGRNVDFDAHVVKLSNGVRGVTVSNSENQSEVFNQPYTWLPFAGVSTSADLIDYDISRCAFKAKAANYLLEPGATPSRNRIVRNNRNANYAGPRSDGWFSAGQDPASNAQKVNPFGYRVRVGIAPASGGTVTDILVDGVSTGLTSGFIEVGGGEPFAITYTGTKPKITYWALA